MAKALAKAKKAAKKKPVKKKAAKKVAVKKLVKPIEVTTKSILAQLTEKGYNVTTDEDGRKEFELRRRSDGVCINRLTMRVDGLVHCCGVDEIGDVEINDSHTKDNETLNLFIAYAFLSIKEESVSIPAKDHKGLTRAIGLIFCSNADRCCTKIERVFKTILKDHFVPTPSTINPNSGNTITIFVAKY